MVFLLKSLWGLNLLVVSKSSWNLSLLFSEADLICEINKENISFSLIHHWPVRFRDNKEKLKLESAFTFFFSSRKEKCCKYHSVLPPLPHTHTHTLPFLRGSIPCIPITPWHSPHQLEKKNMHTHTDIGHTVLYSSAGVLETPEAHLFLHQGFPIKLLSRSSQPPLWQLPAYICLNLSPLSRVQQVNEHSHFPLLTSVCTTARERVLSEAEVQKKKKKKWKK